ncbi:hypothetical protein EDD17DRAFT_1749740 [Pisolithus thermaeus]|nr:hypothetical protein EDD17DRAFT_1749740 [Pisolithus thermaeus]
MADRNLTANTIKPVLTPIKVTAGGTPSLGSHQSHRSEASDSLSVAAEATAVGSNLTANVSGPVVAQADAIDKAIPSPRRAYSLDPDKARDYTRNKAVLSPRRSYSLDPDKARDYMKNIKQFRVLVMGRANAGKTTILQRVCSSTDHPEVFDGKGNKIDGAVVQGTLTRGYHEIERELVFQSNPGFVFHDSCGFEAGSEKQFNQVKEFVVEHAVSTSIKQRIHAIWTVTAAEQKFFNECDTGHVPVIVVLTKVDALNLEAIQDFEDKGLEVEGVEEKVAEREGELLEKWLAYMKDMLGKCKFPPKGYVVLKNMDEEMGDCTALIQCTANTLDEQSSSTLRIEFAVKVTLRDVLYFIHKEGCHVIAKELESVLLSWLQDKVNDFKAYFAGSS